MTDNKNKTLKNQIKFMGEYEEQFKMVAMTIQRVICKIWPECEGTSKNMLGRISPE